MGRIFSLVCLFFAVACDDEVVFGVTPVSPAPALDVPCGLSIRAVRSAIGTRDDASLGREAVVAIAKHPECFEREQVPLPQLAALFEGSARQQIRAIVTARGATGPASDLQGVCETYTAVMGDAKLEVGNAANRDLTEALCAYADASAGTADAYLSALTQIDAIRDDALRSATKKDLVEQAYLVEYRRGNLGSGAFRETYPLADVVDPVSFATDVLVPALAQEPIVVRFFQDQHLDANAMRAVLSAHFTKEAELAGDWNVVSSMAVEYAKLPYDPVLVNAAAYGALMDHREFPLAIRFASTDAERRAAEDGRIRELDASGRYTVVIGPDGKRSKFYPMWDADPSHD